MKPVPSFDQHPPAPAAPLLDEIRVQLRTAVPAASSFLLSKIPWFVSLAFVGRIGPDALAAAALATTLSNVTGMSLGVGLSVAVTTLAGQAVGDLRMKDKKERGRRRGNSKNDATVDVDEERSDENCKEDNLTASRAEEEELLPSKPEKHKEYKSLSMDMADMEPSSPTKYADRPKNNRGGVLMPMVYLYRGIFVQLFVTIPVGIWWLIGVKSALVNLGQGELESTMTEQYLRILAPGLWSYGIGTTLNTWLQTVDMADVPLYASAIGLALHVPFNVLFIHTLGLGYLGAAAATATFQLLQPVLIGLYLFGTQKGRNRALKSMGARAAGYSRLTFRTEAYFAVCSLPGILQYLLLALPGIVMMSDWWASEVLIFLAGLLQPSPSYALDGMTIFQSLNAFAFMIPVGMGVAGAARVGQCLGGNDGNGAQLACRVSAVGAAVLSTALGCIFYFTPHTFFPSIFTSDEDVIDEASKTISLLSISVLADAVQFTLSGAVKGCGRQCILMPVVLVAYWIVGLPLAHYLSFVKYGGVMCNDSYFCGIRGLVGGMTMGTWTHMILLMIIVAACFDWGDEARKARERLATEKLGPQKT